MNKKTSIIVILFIIVIVIIAIYIINFRNIEVIAKTNITATNVDVFDKIENENIERKSDNLKPIDISYIVEDAPVTKMDLDAEERKLSSISEEDKKILCKNENVIIETTKQFVAKQEALNNGYEISENKAKTFKKIAEKFYENSDKTIPKEEFINKWIDIQKRDELADLFMADTIKKIALDELNCNDKNVKEAISKFKENKTSENLNMVYNEYLMYLISQYNIKY